MISFKEIQKHYSKMENNLPRMILKEYLQYKKIAVETGNIVKGRWST